MDVKKILHVGVGRCGNNFVNLMMSKDSRYSGYMINTAILDMEDLKNFKRAGHYLIPHSQGTGRNRDFAFEYAKNNISAMADEFSDYRHFKVFPVYFSTDGGTGSGATPAVVRAIKRMIPNAKIIAIGVFPPLYTTIEALRNTLDCWDDLMKLRDAKLIDGFMFIDNARRETIEEINRVAISQLDKYFKLDTFSTAGILDKEDSAKIICKSSNYHAVLELNPDIKDFKKSLANAIKDSVFLMPGTFECDYVGCLTNNGWVKQIDIRGTFTPFKDCLVGASYKDLNDEMSVGENILVSSGLSIPVFRIEELREQLSVLENNEKSRDYDASLYVNRKKKENDNKSIEVSIKAKVTSRMTASDLDDLFDDDFWG